MTMMNKKDNLSVSIMEAVANDKALDLTQLYNDLKKLTKGNKSYHEVRGFSQGEVSKTNIDEIVFFMGGPDQYFIHSDGSLTTGGTVVLLDGGSHTAEEVLNAIDKYEKKEDDRFVDKYAAEKISEDIPFSNLYHNLEILYNEIGKAAGGLGKRRKETTKEEIDQAASNMQQIESLLKDTLSIFGREYKDYRR